MLTIKQNLKKLSGDEINDFIGNSNNLSNEEITRWLKAVKEYGLDDEETAALTLAMARSGVMLDWKDLEPTIDKHSSGGIGDKVTLLFVPLIAAYGINIPKLSGRALGITGGTIDKLESIKDFNTNLSIQEIKNQVRAIGLAVSSSTKDIAPADKKLYAIRDVTDTIDSIPLIASSIMSKKIAGGAKNIILDVKTGSGAFMKDIDSARMLAEKMVLIGKNLKRNIKALVTDMNQPLGHNIGNSLEIIEVLDVLNGKDIGDLVEITCTLAEEALSMIETCHGMSLHTTPPRKMLLGGEALKKFEEMVSYQKGDLKSGFQKAAHVEIINSIDNGYIQNIDALTVGEAVFNLGAGRKNISDNIDHSVGVRLLKKYGDKISKNESMFEIHAKNKQDALNVKEKLLSSIKVGQNRTSKLKLVHEVIK